MAEDPILSSLVVLRPRSGRLSGHEVITADTVDAYLPDPKDAQRVVARFAAAGFRIHPIVGLSFSIEGPRSQFEAFFQTSIRVVDGEARNADGGLELPLASLSPDVASLVESVSFTPPPDFGPTGYGYDGV